MKIKTSKLFIIAVLTLFVSCTFSTNKNVNDKSENLNEEASIKSVNNSKNDNAGNDAKKPVIYPDIKLSDPKWDVKQYVGRRLYGSYNVKDIKDSEGDIGINVCVGYFTQNTNLKSLDAVDAEMMKEYPQAKRLPDVVKIGKYDAIAYSCVGFLKKSEASEINNKNHIVGFFIPDAEDFNNEGKPVLMKIDIDYDYYADPIFWEETEDMAIMKKAFAEACQSLTFVETDW